MIRFLLILLAVVPAHAPLFSYGFKAGSPVNYPGGFPTLFSSRVESRWTGGPTIELHLPARFSLEFDALYRSHVWDFPLLLKYRFTGGPMRPFVSGGAFYSRETLSRSAVTNPARPWC
jgi:hypothetical protein